MFYRIRQYSFQQTFKKKIYSFFPPPTPPPAAALPPTALFPLVVFWEVADTSADSASWLKGEDGWDFTDILGIRSSSCSIGLCLGSSSATPGCTACSNLGICCSHTRVRRIDHSPLCTGHRSYGNLLCFQAAPSTAAVRKIDCHNLGAVHQHIPGHGCGFDGCACCDYCDGLPVSQMEGAVFWPPPCIW